MIGVARRRLDAASHEQCVLMRDEQFTVEWNLRPAASVHNQVMERGAFSSIFFA